MMVTWSVGKMAKYCQMMQNAIDCSSADGHSAHVLPSLPLQTFDDDDDDDEDATTIYNYCYNGNYN